MKKTSKHRFVHSDPESTVSLSNNGAEKSSNKGPAQNPQDKVTTKDLKRVGTSILIFILILTAFYLLSTRYNILGYFKDLLAL